MGYFVFRSWSLNIGVPMFEFQKLDVYKKAKIFNNQITELLEKVKPSKVVNDQLSRATFSIVLNIAEGSGRFSKPDRRNFFIISRGSIFECVAILDVLRDRNQITSEKLEDLTKSADELSRILYSMIKNLEIQKDS